MDNPPWTSEQCERLADVLMDAFRSHYQLTELAKKASIPLAAINDRSNLSIMATDMVEWAASRSQETELLRVARDINKTNKKLQAFAEELRLVEQPTSAPPRPAVPTPAPALSSLERADRYIVVKAAYTAGNWRGVLEGAVGLAGYRDVEEMVARANAVLARLEQVREELGEAHARGDYAQVIRLAQELGMDAPQVERVVRDAWIHVPIEPQVLRGHGAPVLAVALSANGQLIVSGSWDGTVQAWQSTDDKPLWTVQGHKGVVLAVAVSADGQIVVSGSDDGTVCGWEAADGGAVWATYTADDWVDVVQAVALSTDGQLVVSGSIGGPIEAWQSTDGAKVWTSYGHKAAVQAMAVSADGQHIVSGSLDGTVCGWQAAHGEYLWGVNSFEESWDSRALPVRAVALSADGQLVVFGSDKGRVEAWQPLDNRLVWSVPESKLSVRALVVSTAGQLVASGSNDGTVRLWRMTDGTLLRTLSGHKGVVLTVAMSVAGRLLVSGGVDGTVRLWRFPEGVLR